MGRYTTRLIPFGFLLLLVSKMGVTPTRATTIRLVKGSERGRERKIGGGTERERESREKVRYSVTHSNPLTKQQSSQNRQKACHRSIEQPGMDINGALTTCLFSGFLGFPGPPETGMHHVATRAPNQYLGFLSRIIKKQIYGQ